MSYNNGYNYSPHYVRYGDGPPMSNQQDPRASYGHTRRSSVDTTALGNLAHASSLGQDSRHTSGARDSSSLQQLINYNRSQQSTVYDASLPYGTGNTNYGYGQQLSDSRESASSTRDPYSRNQYQTSSQNPTPTAQQYSQYATAASYNSPTPAYAATSEAYQPVTTHTSYQTSEDQRQKAQQYYPQPVRSTSGQDYRATGQTSHYSPQASQSPTLSTNRATAASSNLPVPSPYHTQRPINGSATPSQQSPYTASGPSTSAEQSVDKRYSASASTAPRTSAQQPSSSRRESGPSQQSPILRTGSQTHKPLDEQIPKTVDPSHVFNHYEYQRRQAAAAAEIERARKVAEAEETRKATEAAAALKRVSESHVEQNPNGPTSNSVSVGKEKEEQMAAEMRLMIEKMRDYKSKDPSLFSQIWEQVKKTQPAGSTPTIPPLSAKDLPGPIPTQQSQINRRTTSDTTRLTSPDQGLGQSVSGASELSGGLPDLGKFPAQRRRRGPYKTHGSARNSKGSAKKNDSSPQVDRSRSSPPIDPALTQASSSSPVWRSPTVTAANPDRQVVYVSGTGPQASSQVDTASPALPSGPMKPPATAAASSVQGTATPAPAQTPKSGGTTWPEHKKWDLAVAAKNTLLASPMNAAKAKNITPEQILGFLHQNPSFEQLCRMIEAKGLIIERSHFARSLLGAIPDIGTSVRQRQQNAIANRQPPAPLQTPPTNGASNGITNPHLDGPDFGILTTQPSSTSQHLKANSQSNGAPAAKMVASNAQQSSITEPMRPNEEKPAVPLTKQEMARKRNISDLVDLSQLSDDDLPPPPPKQPRTEEHTHTDGPRPPTAGQAGTSNGAYSPHLGTSMPQSGNYGTSPYFTPSQYSAGPYQAPYKAMAPYNPYSKYPPLPPYKPLAQHQAPPALAMALSPPSHSAQQRELLNSEDVVQPIDKLKSKKRKRYNPKTIVRDVLIAAGRHPTMQPLNYHLEPLRKAFKHVSDISDLSTFRWDLVDPGGPLALGPVVVGVRPVDNVDDDDADDEAQDDVSQRTPRAPMTVRADMDAEPSVSVSTAVAVPQISHPPKLLGPHRKRAPERADRSEQAEPKVDTSWMSSGLNFSRKPPPDSNPRTPQPASTGAATPTTDPSSGSGIRRRGRPPGAKNKQPRKSSGTLEPMNMPSRPRIDTTPARPSGLRNTVASADGIAVVIPSPSPSIADTKRSRGRPRKQSPRTSQQSTPIHRIYKCKWKGCLAELHNLETLKKHVTKHGDKFAGPFPCLWKDCGRVAHDEGEDDEPKAEKEEPESQPLEYPTKDIWGKHMERRHLVEYAWKLGDGPSVRSDSELSDYLSDSAKHGRAPIIRNEGRPDPLPLTSSDKPAKFYHKAHGITTELGKAEAFLEASEARRKRLGPGMDRVGATFVTKRKNALLDDSVTPLKKVQRGDEEDVL
ncbi:MAG: hypothetical protein Q9224_003358 [Gallowayella concinna]